MPREWPEIPEGDPNRGLKEVARARYEELEARYPAGDSSNDRVEWELQVLRAIAHYGRPPIIGHFLPNVGDVGRDGEPPLSQLRTWTGEDWWPSYLITPKGWLPGDPRPTRF